MFQLSTTKVDVIVKNVSFSKKICCQKYPKACIRHGHQPQIAVFVDNLSIIRSIKMFILL